MKQFTVKDFIAYNNPCFSCGGRITLKIGVESRSFSTVLRPTVKPDRTEVSLKITYTDTLQLWIFHKSNKILPSDARALEDFLSIHKLYLTSQCDTCYTNIGTNYLEFNLAKGYIKPVELDVENLVLIDKGNKYQIRSDFSREKSQIQISKIDHSSNDPFHMEVPLLSLSKFKDRERFLNKLKTYALFS
jgi:hypothetical protein